VPRVEILEITPDLVPQVSAFLASEIGRGIAAAEFSAAFGQRWAAGPAGYTLVCDGTIVGALATIRSIRRIDGRLRQVCNLSSWAVAPLFRTYALALLRRAIEPPETIFTNFTASPAVADILRALRFVEMPVEERVLLPLVPHSAKAASWQADDTIETVLRARGENETAERVRDHRGTRARWVLVEFADGCGVVALHLIHVKRIPFAYVLYCSIPDRFAEMLDAVRTGCARAWGWHLIAWPRAQFGTATGTVPVRRPQPVFFKGDEVAPAEIDGLYSELTLLPILR
jgi:hypothetical protein